MTWANADSGLCLHMASLGSNELKIFHPILRQFPLISLKSVEWLFFMLSAKKTPRHHQVLFEENPPLKGPIMRKTFPCRSAINSATIEVHIFVREWNIMGLLNSYSPSHYRNQYLFTTIRALFVKSFQNPCQMQMFHLKTFSSGLSLLRPPTNMVQL